MSYLSLFKGFLKNYEIDRSVSKLLSKYAANKC